MKGTNGLRLPTNLERRELVDCENLLVDHHDEERGRAVKDGRQDSHQQRLFRLKKDRKHLFSEDRKKLNECFVPRSARSRSHVSVEMSLKYNFFGFLKLIKPLLDQLIVLAQTIDNEMKIFS